MSFPRREPTIATTVRLPESVYYEARALLTDPRTGELRYDSWAPLIARLLRAWVDEQKVAKVDDLAISHIQSRQHSLELERERGVKLTGPALDPFSKAR